MKKIFMLVFAAVMLALSASAYADGDISVMYNGDYLEFTDAKPVIIDGRTLLPFRSVFEQMGAVVDYDNATRTAKASFGGNEITFSLDGKEIYSSASAEPVYVMDVPPAIVDGRTLVPVRAVAEAGGLTVNWDNNERTVVVVDKNGIRSTLEAACPDLAKLRALFGAEPMPYKQTEKTDVKVPVFSLVGDESYTVKAESEITYDGTARYTVCNLKLDDTSFDDELKVVIAQFKTEAKIECIEMKDVFYFKTDLMEVLQSWNEGDAEMSAIAELIPADKWFKVDAGELETFISGSNNGVMSEAMAEIINSDTGVMLADAYLDEAAESFAKIFVSQNNPVFVAEQAAAQLDTYAKDLNFVKVTENADGTADVEISVPYVDYSGNTVKANTYKATYKNGAAVSAELDYSMDGINVKSLTSGEVGGLVEKVNVPENTVNFVDVLNTLINM